MKIKLGLVFSIKYLKKIIFILIFCTYFYFMCKVFLYYKYLTPYSRLPIHKNRPYLIDTEGYKLPDFDPFDPSITSYILDSPDGIDCSDGKRLLTRAVSNYKIENGEYWNAILIQEKNAVDYDVQSFDCCYQTIKRDASGDPSYELHIPDPRYNYSDATFYVEKICQRMKTITMVKADAVFVECSFNSAVFYRNAHMFVTLRPEHVANKNTKVMDSDERLNILIFGIDSISRMNMQRYMPKVFQYMKDISAIDLKGFNKNYENTYPNLCAILSGVYPGGKKFQDKFHSMGNYFDYIPFLWKNFSNAGYVTVYGEDCSFLGTFAYKGKKGFKIVPTDYYFRPFIKAAEDMMGSNKGNIWLTGCGLCTGCELNFQRMLDYVETVSTTLGKTKPHFSLLWTTSLTHDKLHFAGATQEPVLKLLKSMIENGHWNKTLVFFMSDHGIRYGGIRETFLGKLEENLPFNFLIIPKWFREKYSNAYKNLVYNQYRLTSTLDLHRTLGDILNQKYKDEAYVSESNALTENWHSLFRKIPGTRTCFNAEITLNYCSGYVAVEVPETPLVVLSAKHLLKVVNKGLKNFPSCHQLTEFTIYKSFILRFYENQLSNVTYYEIQMITIPGEALLEGIVALNFNGNTYSPTVVGDISRINAYGNQSYCINNEKYSKYCLCK